MKIIHLAMKAIPICLLQMHLNTHYASALDAVRLTEVPTVDREAEAGTTYRKFNGNKHRYLAPEWRTRRGATEYIIRTRRSALESGEQYLMLLANQRSYYPIITVSNTPDGRLANVIVNTSFANMVEHAIRAGDEVPEPNVPASLRLCCEGEVRLCGDNGYFNDPDTYVEIVGTGARVTIPRQESMFGADTIVGGSVQLAYGDGEVATSMRSTGMTEVERRGRIVVTANTSYTIRSGHSLELLRHGQGRYYW
jgi:hypothetical protein